jgi:hypothetical protein
MSGTIRFKLHHVFVTPVRYKLTHLFSLPFVTYAMCIECILIVTFRTIHNVAHCTTLCTCSTFSLFVKVHSHPQHGLSLALTWATRKPYATFKPAFSLLPLYCMLLQAFIMSLKEICIAEHKILFARSPHEQTAGT